MDSARSKSCLDGASKSGSIRRKQSPSPAKQRVKRRKRSVDSENCKAESLTGKDAPLKTKCNRSLSKSPRRNSWRDEILDMKSWKEEKDAASAQKSRSIAVKSKVVQSKRPEQVAVSKLKAHEMKKIPKVQSKSKDILKSAVPSLTKDDSNEKLADDCKAQKDTNIGCFSNEKVSKTVAATQGIETGSVGLMRNKAPGSVRDPRRRAIEGSRMIAANQAVSSVHNFEGEVKEEGAKGALKDVEQSYVNYCVSVNGHQQSLCGLKQLARDSIAERKSGEGISEAFYGHYTVENNAGAMVDSVSRLELQMEVYTTRLKELESQRDQLQKERLAFNCT